MDFSSVIDQSVVQKQLIQERTKQTFDILLHTCAKAPNEVSNDDGPGVPLIEVHLSPSIRNDVFDQRGLACSRLPTDPVSVHINLLDLRQQARLHEPFGIPPTCASACPASASSSLQDDNCRQGAKAEHASKLWTRGHHQLFFQTK